MPSLYTVGQAAKLLGTSPTTTRRLADEFAEHLPDYTPEKGVSRQLSDGDLRTIYAIQSRLQANPALTRADLLRELSTPGSEPIVTPATLPTPTPQEAPGSPKHSEAIAEALHPTQNVLAPFLQAQEDTRRQLENISARMDAISADKPQTTPERIASLVAVGVLAVGIAAAALLSWPQAAVIGSLLALLVHIAALFLRPRG